MDFSSVNALVLAAGKGTRMKSGVAKVLHEVFYAPMIRHVLDAIEPLSLARTVVVSGYQRERLEAVLKDCRVSFAVQTEQLGTGHAVLSAGTLFDKQDGTLMIICGDTPLVRTRTLEQMIAGHLSKSSVLTVMTTRLENPANYGRIISDNDDHVLRIVEEHDATAEQRRIREINAGIYCVRIPFLFQSLKKVGRDNKQGEVYLTDIVSVAATSGIKVDKFCVHDAGEVLGVNSRVELAKAHQCLLNRRNRELMLSGVTMRRPETICIERTASIGKDSIIHADTKITGDSVIGERCIVGPFVIIRNCRLGNDVTVGPFSFLEGCSLKDGEQVAPYTKIC